MKKQKRLSVKDRIELEQRFLGQVLDEAGFGDIREMAARLGVSWRRFRDKRHRALWRAFEALNLRDIGERMDILIAEMETKAKEENANLKMGGDDGADILTGIPGSAAAKQFRKKLITGCAPLLWLERELEAAGAFPLVGGKVYLRKIAEIGERELLQPDTLAEQLFGKKRSIIERE